MHLDFKSCQVCKNHSRPKLKWKGTLKRMFETYETAQRISEQSKRFGRRRGKNAGALSIISVWCLHSYALMREKNWIKPRLSFRILNGICIEKNVRCSFVGYCCFSEELIKIKSSIQMIKVEMDGATSRVWDTEQQMSSEWHFRLAFFNLWTIFIIHAHDHKIFIYLLSIN